MAEKVEVEEFYDKFVQNQKKIGVSTRQKIIHKNLKSIGLKSDSNVLEVGCGIGTVSSLIIKSIPNGNFVGCDISPQSIQLANEMYASEKVEFRVDDMTNFASDLKFDFIVFPDVLEHIPVEQHSNLFSNVAKTCAPDAKVLINIPEPNALNWMRENKPELLQIIDQSLSMQDLLNNTYPHGFEVESITPYSIHADIDNYTKIVLVRNGKLSHYNYLPKLSQFIQNLKVKFFK